MISSINGIIELKSDKFVIIESFGVGYKIFIPSNVLAQLPKQGETARLFTHLYVREDAMNLYGFLTFAQLEFFEKLITISGVGPKVALGVMSIAEPKILAAAIAKGDDKFLSQVPGVGSKIAKKIILELKEKIENIGFMPEDLASVLDLDAVEALVSLGYKSAEARDALRNLPPEISIMEDRVKEALKILGRKN